MKLKRRGIVILFLSPGAVVLIMVTALAYYFMIQQSLYKTNYVVKEFVGLKNYIDSFKDPEYLAVFGTSFLYTAILCPAFIFIPLFFALLLYDTPKWVQNYAKFIFFVPAFASGAIISQVWRWIYNPRLGLLNYLLGLVGIAPIVVMGRRYSAIAGISLMSILGGLGLPLLLYLANMLSIDKELIESARIDGASIGQIRRKIIFPLLVPTVLLILLATMGKGFYLLESILMMTGGTRGTANFMFDIFQQGINKRAIGMASARSMLIFLIVIVMLMIKRKIETYVRKEKKW